MNTVHNIHVVSFQVPWPADYGGAIDVYYKLKALHEAGYNIILHTYIYGERTPQPMLEELCNKVYYYERETGWKKQFSVLPYIVSTRCNPQLLENLCKDDSPILFEGLHTCFFLYHPMLANRKKIVRMHNIEHLYYRSLAVQAGWNWRSLYYWAESVRLRRYESILQHADLICGITKADQQYLIKHFPEKKIIHLPCFFDTAPLASLSPSQTYHTEPFVLYHGNLSVEENQRVVRYILRHIAPLCPGTLFVIAGRNPNFANVPRNVKIIANPSDEYLDQLIETARIHLMLTFQSTGIKLKLLNVLTKGRGHIIANRPMLYGHSLGRFCTQADETSQIAEAINTLMGQPIEMSTLENRNKVLLKMKKAGISRLSLFE